MTETTVRLRWEPGEDGILFGYSGTLKPWVFAICPPSAPGDFWMISTSFPLGQPRYVGSEKEARNAAERWLEGFTASLGAIFPDEPKRPSLAWHADWAEVDRDSSGNAILRHKPTGGMYKIMPAEEC